MFSKQFRKIFKKIYFLQNLGTATSVYKYDMTTHIPIWIVMIVKRQKISYLRHAVWKCFFCWYYSNVD